MRRPTLVRLRWGRDNATPALRVGAGGSVNLPRPVRARSFELEVLDAGFAPDVPAARRRIRAVGIAEIEGVRGLPAVRGGSGELAGRCGALSARVGARTFRLGVTAGRAAFESGRPLQARQCGGPVRLPAGEQRLSTRSGAFAFEILRLTSPAPAPGAPGAGTGGRVLAPGRPGRGRLDDVRVSVDGPAWLVLGEGYNRGWRAWCGERDLGAPEPVDGYANGWRIDRDCRNARFAFAPNRSAVVGYAVSLLACLACLALVVVDPRRRAPALAVMEAGDLSGGDRPERWPLLRALAAALASGAVIAFLFGPLAGAAAVLGVLVVLRSAVGARGLALAGGALLAIVVPVLYLVHPADAERANNVAFPVERIAAHWVAVAGLIALLAALLRTLAGARPDRGRPGRRAAMLARARGRERLHTPGDPPPDGARR